MILGVSHIVLGSSNVERDAAFFGALGYEQAFVERNLSLDPAERRLLAPGATDQTIAYLNRKTALPVELISYGQPTGPTASHFHLIFSESPSDALPSATPRAALASAWESSGRGILQAVHSDDFQTTFHWSDQSGPSQVMMEVSDLAGERRFFEEGLGARISEEGPGWMMCSLRGLMPQWCANIMLVEGTSGAPELGIDAAGFPCLSFLSSDLARDRKKILGSGPKSSSGIFFLTVNGKPLALEIVRTSSGALVELVQMLKEKK